MSLLDQSFVFSQSSLQTFRYCPQRFFLHFVKRLVWPAPMQIEQGAQLDLLAGTRFHQLLYRYHVGFEKHLLLEQARADEDSRMANWLESFFKSPYSDLEGLLLPEKSFTVPLGEFQITAKFDLLQIKEDGSLIIFDWKTSRTLPSAIRLRSQFQSMVYPLVASKRFTTAALLPAIEMIYWEANFPNQPVIFQFDPIELTSFESKLITLMREISSMTEPEFVRTQEFRRCSWCEYRSYCNRGVQAGAIDPEIEHELPGYESEIPIGDTQPWG